MLNESPVNDPEFVGMPLPENKLVEYMPALFVVKVVEFDLCEMVSGDGWRLGADGEDD